MRAEFIQRETLRCFGSLHGLNGLCRANPVQSANKPIESRFFGGIFCFLAAAFFVANQVKKKLGILFFSAIYACCLSQNLDKLGKKEMTHVGGGLNYSSVFYNAYGIPDRRQPFTWFLNGNITASILDISLPFTFNYSNNQIAYSQPYMLQSFNPTYKWIKGYAGVTSMNFSPYTLAGHLFSGAGVELTPKNFKFAVMAGRLNKAVEFDTENNSDLTMSYKRMGFGASAAYENSGKVLKLIFFSAKDDAKSLVFIPVNTTVTPMQNTVLSISGKTTLNKNFKIETEYALSGLTKNISASEEMGEVPKNKLPFIFRPTAVSKFYRAFKSGLGYHHKIFGISLNYERVDPGYATLGAYYFNNDLENITLAPVFTFLKGKLNLALNTGLQRNNLDKSKLNTTKRWVGSANANYVPDKSWNFSGSYSNFSTYTRQRPQTDPFYQNTLDTLNFYQLSQSSMLGAGYNFGSAAKKQVISLAINYQVTGQNQGNISDPGFLGGMHLVDIPQHVLNGNIGHNLVFVKSKFSISTSLNGNYSHLAGSDIFYFGPNLNLGRAFSSNKIRVTAGTSYNQILTNGEKTGELFCHRLSLNYSPKFASTKIGKVSMTLSISYLQKLKSQSPEPVFSEFTGNFGINYTL